jgi:hypothetical protein
MVYGIGRTVKLIPDFIVKLFHKDEPVRYDTFYQNANLMSKEQKELLKSSRRILIDNRVPLNKLKFVFETQFIYDIDKNTINPVYKQLVPNSKKHHIIEIGVPQNTMNIFLGENRTYNNYELLKDLLRKSKKGIVILVDVDYDDVMWLANLDDAIDYYHTQQELHDVD